MKWMIPCSYTMVNVSFHNLFSLTGDQYFFMTKKESRSIIHKKKKIVLLKIYCVIIFDCNYSVLFKKKLVRWVESQVMPSSENIIDERTTWEHVYYSNIFHHRTVRWWYPFIWNQASKKRQLPDKASAQSKCAIRFVPISFSSFFHNLGTTLLPSCIRIVFLSWDSSTNLFRRRVKFVES